MATQRIAGFLILGGIIVAMLWRIVVAPAVLGDFDPADMPHGDRAFLSIGNVGVALLFAAALWLILRLHQGSATERLAHVAALLATAAAGAALLATIGLIWIEPAIRGLILYVVLAGLAWVLAGYATFRRYRGGLGWTALATAVIYGLATMAIFAGAFIIFVMTVAALPFAIALVAAKPTLRRVTPDAPMSTAATGPLPMD